MLKRKKETHHRKIRERRKNPRGAVGFIRKKADKRAKPTISVHGDQWGIEKKTQQHDQAKR